MLLPRAWVKLQSRTSFAPLLSLTQPHKTPQMLLLYPSFCPLTRSLSTLQQKLTISILPPYFPPALHTTTHGCCSKRTLPPQLPQKFSQSATSSSSSSSSPLWTECNLTANLSENSPYQKKKKKTPTTICREEIDPETEAQTIAAIKERWRQNQNEKMKNA
jgi:hypothetical protein